MNELQKIILNTLGQTGGGRSSQTVPELIEAAIPYSGRELEESLATLSSQLGQLRSVSQAQIEALGENTEATNVNTQAQAGTGVGSRAGEVARTASKVLGGGLGLMPLLSGLLGLFTGGKKSEPPPPLLTYIAPTGRNWEGAAGQAGSQPIPQVDYGQDGLPRIIQPAGSSYAPQVTVQVQALDSRSFLDHSDEIARAVREAMLHAHSLNDVLNEL